MRAQRSDPRPLVGRTPSFRRTRSDAIPVRMLLYVILILGFTWLVLQTQNGSVQPLFLPTATPTRTANSYIQEAEAYFQAGRLDDRLGLDAIEAYQQALAIDPQNAAVQAELARIMTYSSVLLSTVEERRDRLEEARLLIDQASELAPDDSTIFAIRSFVYDWNSNPSYAGDLADSYLTEARLAAARALQLNPNNALALAFYAEVLVDQQEWSQAQQYVQQAVLLDPNLMDVHRVNGYVLESLGQYNAAIQEYLRAAEITPNLTFLYIAIGLNFRSLEVYNRALEFFERAATIDAALGVRNPIPYIEIAKTYAQQGEFFIASRNAEKALSFDPGNPNSYGQLGSIYVQARNYENATPVLGCVIEGCEVDIIDGELLLGGQTIFYCPAEGCTMPADGSTRVQVTPLPLSSLTVAYYYLRYGSVLAAVDECARAIPVLQAVQAAYPDDTVIGSIIAENYVICGQ